MIQPLTLSQLKGHDVYEFAYAHSYPQQMWSADSLYLSDDGEGIVPLIPYLSTVFHPFPYYGIQKVTIVQWSQVYDAYQRNPHRDLALEQFFATVVDWLHAGNAEETYFWILGI